MPFKIEALQESFKLELADGVPVAPITKLGAMYYTLICPLCGLLHEVGQQMIHGSTVTPRCIVKPPHSITVANWRKAHPETVGYTTIKLVQTLHENIISAPAPERIAA